MLSGNLFSSKNKNAIMLAFQPISTEEKTVLMGSTLLVDVTMHV